MAERSVPETEVFDHKGKRILASARVVIDPSDEQMPGTVKWISDPDVDTDDEGRPYGINPDVAVQWDDAEEGELDRLGTSHSGDYDTPEFTCDDLEVIDGGQS